MKKILTIALGLVAVLFLGSVARAAPQYVSGLAAVSSVQSTDTFYDCPLNTCGVGTIGNRASALQLDSYFLSTLSATAPLSYNSGTGAFSIPLATNAAMGAMEGDGTTLTCTAGICSAIGGGGGGGNMTGSGATTTGNLLISNNTGSTLLTAADSGIADSNVATLSGPQTFTGSKTFNSGDLILAGSGSGTLTIKPASAAGTSTLTLPGGTTDFSTTGGADEVVQQGTVGGAFTVGQLTFNSLAGQIGAAQMVTLPVNDVYYGNGSSQPVATSFATLLASPPPIGGTAPAAGNFTNLTATGSVQFSGLTTGTQVSCMGLSSGNQIVLTAAGCGSGGTTTITLGTSLTSTPGTYNTGTQTVTNSSTLSTQLYPESHATSYALASTDGGKLPYFTASGQTATFPNPGSAGTGFQFGYDGMHTYSITTAGGTATITGCGTSGTTLTAINYAVQLLSDGTNYICVASGASSSGSGTVTSVAMTVPSWLTVAGSPITSSGTLAVTATGAQTANEVLATPNGSSGAVGLRALAGPDIPAVTGNALTDGATVTVPAVTGAGSVNTLTITGSGHTIANPTSMVANQYVNFVITENGTGGFTPAWGGQYGFPAGTPVFNTAANAVNVVSCVSTSSTQLQCLGPSPVQLGFLYSAAGTPLPTCNAGESGIMLQVSDATSPTYNGSYTSGGAVHVPVYCNGTAWSTH